MNRTEARNSLANDGFFSHWMSRSQRMVLANGIDGEESNFFVDLPTKLKERIEGMQKTYETDEIEGYDKIVHLHYFKGSFDAWIVEKDIGDGTDLLQLQAYGKSNMYGDGIKSAEWGYIAISELIENGVELDLHWDLCAIKDVK